MYKTWSASATELSALERAVDTFLNEYVDDLVSISYAVHDRHYVLVVYRPLDLETAGRAEAMLNAAEEILGRAESRRA